MSQPKSASQTAETQPGANHSGGRRPIRPSDLCRLRSVADVTLHPDANTVVYQVAWPDNPTDSNRAQLFCVDVDGTNRRQLTFGHRDGAAAFSPDGTRLAFLRSEPTKPTAVMVLEWPVGELTEVTTFEDGAGWLDWLTDDRLVVTATTRPDAQQGVTREELAKRPRILTTIHYRSDGRGYVNDRPNQVFVVDARPAATPQPIGAPRVDHGSVAVSPDGRHIVAVARTDQNADLTGANHVWLYSVDGGQDPLRLTDVGGQWGTVAWHHSGGPDGTIVALGSTDNSVTGFDKAHRVTAVSPGERPKVELIGDHDQHLVPSALSGRAMVPDGEGFLLPGVRAGRVAVDHYNLETGARTVIHEDAHQVAAFDTDPDRTVTVAAITSVQRPAELWRIDGRPRKLVSLNDELLAELDLAATEVVMVESEPGVEVQAFITRPPESAPDVGRPAPGLLYIHGGPMFHYGLGFFDEFQMAAACGYVVIAGNPRGSDGYGERWAQAPIGDLGNRDWVDVAALADHLSALPEVDSDRLGVGGGSYGGFMTGWVLSHDTRFKAGLIERAVTSWKTFYGTSDIGTWFTAKTIGATEESNPGEVARQSPLHHAAEITAPTLIVHSEHDWRCPIEQAEQLFAALRRAGRDVTMVRFPDESHGLTRNGGPVHRVERFEIVHEFFARHLQGGDFGTSHLTDAATA